MATAMKRWYSKFGPLSWYKASGGQLQWIKLIISLHWFLLIDAHFKPSKGHGRRPTLILCFGGRVIRHSAYGSPSCIDPWIYWSSYEPHQLAPVGLHWWIRLPFTDRQIFGNQKVIDAACEKIISENNRSEP